MARTTLPMLLSFLAAVLLSAFPTQADTIRGRVFNETLSRPQPNCAVSLVAHGAEVGVVSRDTTGASGDFALETPADTAGVKLFLSASWDDIDYVAPFGRNPTISVYEKTSSDSAISVVSHHIVIDAAAREVTQILVYRNAGNRTYATGEGHGHGLEIPLPEGVTELLRAGQGVHLHDNLLVDPRPVRPGRGQVAFGFAVPASGDLRQMLPYRTEAVDAMVTPPEAKVAADAFQDVGETSFGERRFRRYTRSGLAAGSGIDLRLVQDDMDSWVSGKATPWVLAGLVLLTAGVALYFGTKSRQQASVPASGLQMRRQALLAQIADLDDRHAGGEVSEEDYKARREALKAEVVRLTQELSAS